MSKNILIDASNANETELLLLMMASWMILKSSLIKKTL